MPIAYNALTGAELKKIILAEVERELDNAGIEGVGRTFPMVSWHWQLKLVQRDAQGIPVTDFGDREIEAGDPELPAVIEKAATDAEPADKVLNALRGSSKRFKHQPPSPTEVRTTEKLPQPEG